MRSTDIRRSARPPSRPIGNRPGRVALVCLALTSLAGSAALLAPFGTASSGPASPASPASDSLPAPTPADLPVPARPKLRDVQLTVMARRALEADPKLGPNGLGVDVRNGVATVWGRLPEDTLIPLALAQVRKVPGVLDVRSDLYVGEDDPAPRPDPAPLPTQSTSASPDPESGILSPIARRPTVSSPRRDGPHVSAPGEGGGVSLRRPETDGSKPATLASGVPLSLPDLAATVDRVRGSDERFRRVPVSVLGRTVLVGPSRKTEDVIALARALSTVPGVERVEVRNAP